MADLKELAGKKKKKNWIAGAVSHPGSEKAAAARNGRSTLQEAKVEAKSKDPHIRGRGLLAERFIKKSV